MLELKFSFVCNACGTTLDAGVYYLQQQICVRPCHVCLKNERLKEQQLILNSLKGTAEHHGGYGMPDFTINCDECKKAITDPVLAQVTHGQAYCSNECKMKNWERNINPNGEGS
jgi:hypothetical protein